MAILVHAAGRPARQPKPSDSILRKIYYVRYGRPNDAVYVKIGALDNVTLGYGLIMDTYRNTLHYPGIKKTGLQFRIANFCQH